MARPQSYSMGVYRGDSYRWQFQLWADESRTIPVDLTNIGVSAEIHQSGHESARSTIYEPGYSGPYVRHDWYGSVVPLSVTVTGNQIDVVLSAALSRQLDQVRSRWDLQLTYPAGDVKTIMTGSVLVRGDVTGSTAA